jgi:hypothetical protein
MIGSEVSSGLCIWVVCRWVTDCGDGASWAWLLLLVLKLG